MSTTSLTQWIGRAAIAAAPAALLAGCELFAISAEPGDISARWLVNEQTVCKLGQGAPVLVQLHMTNTLSKRVRLPEPVQPLLHGYANPRWREFHIWPRTLGPAEEWQGMWLLEEDMLPGSHEIVSDQSTPITAAPARIEVLDRAAPRSIINQQRSVIAQLTGTAHELIEELAQECASGQAMPTTHLQLANLLENAGDREEARAHYETFSELVYDSGAVPNWLKAEIHTQH